MRSTAIGLGVLLLAGCGGGPDAKSPRPLTVPNPFPTKTSLEQLAAAPTQPVTPRTVVSVPSYRFEADVPDTSVAEKRLAEIAPDLKFTRELRCVARELARLRSEHGGDPDERVERFILGACGVTSPAGAASYYVTGEVPKEASDDEVLKAWKSKLTVPPSFKGRAAGAWLTRKGAKATLLLASAAPEGSVEVTPTTPDGRVVIRGTTTEGTDYVLGLVNRGRDSVARCEPDPSVVLPQFAFQCTMAEGDPWAWIEIATRANGRLLLRGTALVLARRSPSATLELTASAAAGAKLAAADVSAAVVEGVNRARASAKLEAVTLAPQESAVSTRIASHFFSAEQAGNGSTTDLIALGLLAGWDVQGTIRNGNFFGTMLTGSTSPASWLDYALDQPVGRFTLLQPDARQIAVGTAAPESVGGLGVVITSYAFFGAEDPQAKANRVMAGLTKERAARHLPPLKALGALPTLAQEAQLVHDGKREPMAALDRALGEESQRIGQSMRGWVVVTNDLDVIPFPKELLVPDVPPVRVVVTSYRPEGSAWGFYLVYFASPAPGTPQNVASL